MVSRNTLRSLPLLFLATLFAGSSCAVERPRPAIEDRTKNADLVIVADDIQPLPHEGKEFDKFFRVRARIASILKGDAAVGDQIEVIVDNTIAELHNDCCIPGKIYVLFLRHENGKYSFVGSPLGAIQVELGGSRTATQ